METVAVVTIRTIEIGNDILKHVENNTAGISSSLIVK